MAGIAGIAVVPAPERIEAPATAGRFVLGPRTALDAPGELRRTGELLQARLRPATRLPLPLVDRGGKGPGKGGVVLRLDPSLGRLGPEGYRLTAREDLVEIAAPAPAGVFHGTQTLLQLLPPEIFRAAKVDRAEWALPCVTIEDSPRFGWRGSHLDAARHFLPVDFVKKHLDLMALHKLNVLHWHLTDDQGWRIEILGAPRLTEIGAQRRESPLGKSASGDGRPHGGFYTQDDVREVVRYAAERFVTVVPEIEMPGHAQAAIAACPELGNAPDGPPVEVWTRWGISENILNPEETTISFLEGVLDEVSGLFPGPFVHVGGDEAPKKQWKESAAAQERIRALGLRDEAELQAWFVGRIGAFLASRGKRLVGWDEILEGGLAPGATVMSWRGVEGGIEAARAGHDVVMAPSSHTYLDYYQSKAAGEPLAIGGFLPLEKVYAFEPIPPALTPEEGKRVLGTQGQLWAEYLPAPRDVEYMAWPRLAALAEVAWSPRESRDWSSFLVRMRVDAARLDALGVHRAALPGERPRR